MLNKVDRLWIFKYSLTTKQFLQLIAASLIIKFRSLPDRRKEASNQFARIIFRIIKFKNIELFLARTATTNLAGNQLLAFFPYLGLAPAPYSVTSIRELRNDLGSPLHIVEINFSGFGISKERIVEIRPVLPAR